MPQVRSPESPPKLPINVPICPSCLAAMRLCTVEADTKYINLDVYFYACHCGVVSRIFRTFDQATAPVCITCGW